MDKVHNIIKKGFDNGPVYNEKYLKTKKNSYDGKINTNFHGNKIPKEGSRCICLSVILNNSVFGIGKTYLFLEECIHTYCQRRKDD